MVELQSFFFFSNPGVLIGILGKVDVGGWVSQETGARAPQVSADAHHSLALAQQTRGASLACAHP